MRIALLITLFLPVAAYSDVYTMRSTPKNVTVYSEVAQVQRVLEVDLPIGAHAIVLPDLPEDFEIQSTRVEVKGALLQSVAARNDALPPLEDADPQAIVNAREEVETRQAALDRHLDAEAKLHLDTEAATAQIDFLNGLSQNENLPTQGADLGAIANMIGTQTREARQQMLNADIALRGLNKAREELEEDVQIAEEALAALSTSQDGRVQMTLSLLASAATKAEITVTYFVSARWEPLYDVYLDQAEAAKLTIKRGASVAQASGENWEDVVMTLSTLPLSEQQSSSRIRPLYLRSVAPAKTRPVADLSNGLNRTLAEPVVDAPMIVEEATANPIFDGPGVTYVLPGPVSVANGVDDTRVALDALSFEAAVFARAVPLQDETAYLTARFTNTSSEPIFKTYQALSYLDNTLVGSTETDEIPAGGEGEFSFGPIQELRLARVVLDRNEGESGFISRSNTRNEEVRIDIENLGQKSWPVEVIDRVPFSEQEDLEISFTATPQPDHQDLDDQRGILQWDIDLPGGAKETVVLKQDIRWPEGNILQ